MAERPDDVVTPPGLVTTLLRTERKLAGGLALVSGRPIHELDRLFEPLRLRASGVHGAEMRFDAGGPPISALGARELPQSLFADLRRVVAAFPGAFVENKRFSFAVHYRLASGAERSLREAVMRLVDSARIAIEVMDAHYAIELKAPGCDKGGAIATFLSTPAFRGRTPIFVGDDMTDESGFAVVAARGGYAFSVGSRRAGAVATFSAAERGPRLARGIRRPRGRCMTGRGQTKSQNLDLAVIGNSCSAALIDRNARIVWWCFPYFDSDPIFSRLLADDEDKGFCEVTLADMVETDSRYQRNTAIVETILTDSHGAKVRISDFAPWFQRFEREYRPPQIIRRIEPLAGLPRITIRVRPTHNYGRPTTNIVVGSNHIRYIGGAEVLRLNTDAPLSYIVNEITFPLTRPVNLIFGQDDPFLSAINTTSREFLDRTRDHWLTWTRNLAVPFEWQSAVVRAAITLRLCCFVETGAIVAAHTTSIPEAPSSTRTWDYRYCWLRDAYFVVQALNRLGATQTMEAYINYITTIATAGEDMRPVHGIVPFSSLEETIAPDLKGFLGYGPVRVGNQAEKQTQNDAYGSIVLAAGQMFVDERLPKMGDELLFHLLEISGESALAHAFEPDAGLWEYRARMLPHTYSATLCWAACDRLAIIARRLNIADRAKYWTANARALREKILSQAWDEKRGALTGAFGEPNLDASVLLVAELGLLPASDARYVKTCETIGHELARNGWIMRYTAPDDFGLPETAFLACNFWYVDALSQIGRAEEARERFESILASRNSYGLLSEDIHPETGELWGNLPQTYSMAGIINTATRLSSSWEEAWARDLS